MSETVAWMLFDTYPEYRKAFDSNYSLPPDLWSATLPTSLPSRLVARLLFVNDPEFAARVVDAEDRRTAVIKALLDNWVLPADKQRRLVADKLPIDATFDLLASYILPDLKIHAARTGSRIIAVAWLLSEPKIDDSDYLHIITRGAASSYVELLHDALVLLVARRGYLIDTILTDESYAPLLWIAALVSDRPEQVCATLLKAEPSKWVNSAAQTLADRHDLSEADFMRLTNHFSIVTPPNDRTDTSVKGGELIDLLLDTESNASTRWKLFVAAHCDGLNERRVSQILTYLAPGHYGISALFGEWVSKYVQPALGEEVCAHNSELADSLAELELRSTWGCDQCDLPADGDLPAPRDPDMPLSEFWTPDSSIPAVVPVTVADIATPYSMVDWDGAARYLHSELGHADTDASIDAWCLLINATNTAAPERTLSELVASVRTVVDPAG